MSLSYVCHLNCIYRQHCVWTCKIVIPDLYISHKYRRLRVAKYLKYVEFGVIHRRRPHGGWAGYAKSEQLWTWDREYLSLKWTSTDHVTSLTCVTRSLILYRRRHCINYLLTYYFTRCCALQIISSSSSFILFAYEIYLSNITQQCLGFLGFTF